MKGFFPLLGLWLLTLASPGTAEPRITDFAVEVDGNRALLSFGLEGVLDRRFDERVESGLPTGFVYRFELIRHRRRWFNNTLERSELQVVATYDAVDREYLVNYKLDGKLVDSRMARDLEEVRRVMTQLNGFPAFTLEGIPGRWPLVVRLRAELGSKALFALIPTTVATDWVESRKFSSPNNLP